MEYSYSSLKFINLAFHKLKMVNFTNLEFKEEENNNFQ